ncbi:NitT/TauT family transport system permease protein [Shimia gijangensis]|uniref:NitT/TauT family transport system permease protein n=1 Tax=Shimia gijangensis TaxID=1470563 RepID=A0A1M6T6X0_9RHOB|nr:ABC transporter permease [Shimia gijangensis]SHK52650.1 NitT/TauT family transport system permease protein [Shimia gijangensis]
METGNIKTAWGMPIWVLRLVLLSLLCLLWEWATVRQPSLRVFVGQPSGIAVFFWDGLFVNGKLIQHGFWSILATLISFGLGSVAGILTGMMFAMSPRLEVFFQPILIALNSLPRIALAPLFLLWFGLGMGSKIALAFSLTFFIVLDSTVAGMRSVNPDHVTLARTIGASPGTIFRKITLVSALPTIFTGLRLGMIYALLGVIGSEIIASTQGLGQYLSFLAGVFNTDGVFAVLLLLAILGSAIGYLMTRIEARLLRWK